MAYIYYLIDQAKWVRGREAMAQNVAKIQQAISCKPIDDGKPLAYDSPSLNGNGMTNMKTLPMKTIAFAAPAKYITEAAKLLRKGGYDVERTSETMKATMVQDNGERVVVAMALKMRTVWCLRAAPEVMRGV